MCGSLREPALDERASVALDSEDFERFAQS
jgi:hypothetical protein